MTSCTLEVQNGKERSSVNLSGQFCCGMIGTRGKEKASCGFANLLLLSLLQWVSLYLCVNSHHPTKSRSISFSHHFAFNNQRMNIIQDASNDFGDLKALERHIEVPFYIYQTPSIRELYGMCQKTARNVLNGKWPASLPLADKKNVDEIYWLDQLWNDSWRTFDPDKALVYVLPIYPGLSTSDVTLGQR